MSVNTPLSSLDHLSRLPLEIYIPPSSAPLSRVAVPISAERGQSEVQSKREERQEDKRMILRERKVKQAVKVYLDEVDRETTKREIRRKKPRKNEEKGRSEG
jgi:hypothetical protein